MVRPKTRAIPIFVGYLQKVAVVVLLLGAGYWGGVKHPDVWGVLQEMLSSANATRGQTIENLSTKFSENASYRRVINKIVWNEILSQLPSESSLLLPETVPLPENTLIVCEI
jgi:hypothetical protein